MAEDRDEVADHFRAQKDLESRRLLFQLQPEASIQRLEQLRRWMTGEKTAVYIITAEDMKTLEEQVGYADRTGQATQLLNAIKSLYKVED